MEALSPAAYAAFLGGCTLHKVEDAAATEACSVCQEVAEWENALEEAEAEEAEQDEQDEESQSPGQ